MIAHVCPDDVDEVEGDSEFNEEDDDDDDDGD